MSTEGGASPRRGWAASDLSRLVPDGTLQQPTDARDVVRAIDSATSERTERAGALDLGGPECLAHRELVARAAAVLGRPAPSVVSLPLGLARGFAAIAGRLASDPPITPAMLGVLQHDDRVDPGPACEQLGLALTPLDETLAHCLIDASQPEAR